MSFKNPLHELLITLAAACLAAPALAQFNLVPNPSFDVPQLCPTGDGQLAACSPPWFNPGNGSPDTFNSCSPKSSDVSVPKNFRGTQAVRTNSSTGYAGFLAAEHDGHEHEYIEVQLIHPLVAGQKYKVSFYVSLANKSGWEIGDIGAYFSVGAVTSSNSASLPFTPQFVSNQGWLGDRGGWELVTGSFTAGGGEDHMTIGGFTPDGSQQFKRASLHVFNFTSYYYIDDVSVVCECTSTPSIQTQPQSQTVPCGQGATLTAAASPDTCVNSLQWVCEDCFATPTVLKNNNYFSGTDTPTLTLSPLAVTTFKGKTFRFEAVNDCGTASSNGATVAPIVPPITLEPVDVTICPPEHVSFTVAAAGSGWKYQWYWLAPGGSPVPFEAYQGGKTATLSFDAWPELCGATVYCVLTNPCGTNVSRSAKINCCGCTPPPTNMALWLPFDQVDSSGVTRNVVSGYGGVLWPLGAGPALYNGWFVDNSLWFNGVAQYVTVQNHDLVDVTDGDLTLDAWVFIEGVYEGVNVLIDKRLETGAATTGYHMFLYGNAGSYELGFQLADGTYTNWFTSTGGTLTGGWHHFAVTVARKSHTGGNFYVDGAAVGAFDPTGHQGSLSNAQPFTVAARSTVPSGFFSSAIDEVELFRRALAPSEIAAIYNAKTSGKCKQFIQVYPATIFCKDAVDTTIGAYFFNFTGAAATFNGKFNSFFCAFPPTNLPMTLPPIPVGPWSWTQRSVAASKDPAMPANFQTCHLANFATATTTCTSMGVIVNRPDLACSGGLSALVRQIPLGGAANIALYLGNGSAGGGAFQYRVEAIGPDGRPSGTLSLNGEAPGAPILGVAHVPGGGTFEMNVEARFVGVDALGITTLLLSTDANGDGAFEPADSAALLCVVPDPGQCGVGDFNCDGAVDGADVGLLLLDYGPCGDCATDLDGNGYVDSADLGLLFLNYT